MWETFHSQQEATTITPTQKPKKRLGNLEYKKKTKQAISVELYAETKAVLAKF